MEFTLLNIFKVAGIILLGGIIATILILVLALLIIESVKAIRKAIKNERR